MGGVEKAEILRAYRPHIFFDDQLTHVEGAAPVAPSVHMPFGVANA
jgi:5'-nucleotidase